MKSPRIYEKNVDLCDKNFMQDFFQKLHIACAHVFFDETKKVTMKNFC